MRNCSLLYALYPHQQKAFCILCALKVYQEENFVKWANKWLTGEDRSSNSAGAAAYWACSASDMADDSLLAMAANIAYLAASTVYSLFPNDTFYTAGYCSCALPLITNKEVNFDSIAKEALKIN